MEEKFSRLMLKYCDIMEAIGDLSKRLDKFVDYEKELIRIEIEQANTLEKLLKFQEKKGKSSDQR